MMKVQMDQTCDAVKSTAPQDMWGETIEKLEELEQHPEALDVGTDSFNGADDERCDPTEFIDEDDVCGPPRRPPSPRARWARRARAH